MGPKDVIRNTLITSDHIFQAYVGDLSDADFRLRPIEGMHPIAVQLGHLLVTERMFTEMIAPGSAPALPEGFEAAHDIKNASLDDSGFLTKSKYLEIAAAQRAATLAALDSVTDGDLDDTKGGKLPQFAPTVGAVLSMVGLHGLMHYGQFVAVRRALKKPVAI